MQGWEIELSPCSSRVAEESTPFIWASPKELADTYSIPSAFQYFLHQKS